MQERIVSFPKREVNGFHRELPPLIRSPYPYITLGDLPEVINRCVPTMQKPSLLPVQNILFALQREIVPAQTTFIAMPLDSLTRRLTDVAVQEAEKGIGVVVIDRYVAEDVSHDNIFRLQVSRTQDSKPISRPGTTVSPQEQVKQLSAWAKGFQEIILMDDLLTSGSTISPLINRIREESPNTRIRLFMGIATSGGKWSGVEKIREAFGLDTEYLTLVVTSEENEVSTGMALVHSRDMTFFGGRLQSPDLEGNPIASPHFLPFTITERRNFPAMSKRLEAAEVLLEFNIQLSEYIEELTQKPFLMGDLLAQGFGMPYSNIQAVQKLLPSLNPEESISSYLRQVQHIYQILSDRML